MRRRHFGQGTIAAVAANALAFGRSATSARPVQAAARASDAMQLNLYSARHYDTDTRLFSDFTAQTGVQINLIEGTEDQLISRIQSEGTNTPADVLLTVDAGRLWRADEAGLFQPVSTEVLDTRVPAHLRHPEGNWFGLTKRVRVIAYARNRVDPSELSTYEALAWPKWRRRILVRSSSNVYNQSLVGSLIEANGLDATQEWAKALVANMARRPQGGDTDQLKAVAAGVGDLALSNHYYYARLAKSEKREDRDVAEQLGLFFPNQGEDDRGAHVNISGAGVIATAPHRDNAIAFLEYLLGDEAQAVFAQGNNEFPVVEGVEADPLLASWGPFKEDHLNAAVFGYNGRGALFLMDRAGWR